MATGWPEYKFIIGNQKPVLYFGGYKLFLNRIRENKNGDKTAYFYCVNKVKNGINCMSAAKAMILEHDEGEADRYILSNYTETHSEFCVPNCMSKRSGRTLSPPYWPTPP